MSGERVEQGNVEPGKVEPADLVVRMFCGNYLIWRVLDEGAWVWSRHECLGQLMTRIAPWLAPVNWRAARMRSGSATGLNDTARSARPCDS